MPKLTATAQYPRLRQKLAILEAVAEIVAVADADSPR
jgi:hypothetical protein